jgi:Skp family chaperone for outer membrane proteins
MKTAFLAAIPAALVLAFVTFNAEGQTAAPGKVPGVVYISSNRLMNEAVPARTELARVQAMQQQKNAELRTKQQAVDATRLQLAQATDAETRARLVKQEQDQRADFERSQQQAQADLQRLQREVQAEVQTRVRDAIAEMAKTQDIRLVVNQDTTVVWAVPGMDITSTLIERLNASATAKP